MKTTNTNRILETMVANGVLVKLAKELGLKKVPTIKYVNEHNGYVMSTKGTKWHQHTVKFTTQLVTKTEASYEILVNLDALNRAQTSYCLCTLNPKAAKYVTLVLLRITCRHIWQYQEGFFVGKTEELFQFSMDAPGTIPENKDAIEYAINASKTKYAQSVAEFIREEMNQTLINKHFGATQELRDAGQEMIRTYNPFLAKIAKVVTVLR